MTHARPQTQRLTAPIAHGHHVLEDVLAHPITRRLLGWLACAGKTLRRDLRKLL